MSAAVAFDTLKFTRRLEEAGIPRNQAEAQADAFREAQAFSLEDMATKADIEELQHDMKALELRLIKWMFGMLAGQAALIITLLKMH